MKGFVINILSDKGCFSLAERLQSIRIRLPCKTRKGISSTHSNKVYYIFPKQYIHREAFGERGTAFLTHIFVFQLREKTQLFQVGELGKT